MTTVTIVYGDMNNPETEDVDLEDTGFLGLTAIAPYEGEGSDYMIILTNNEHWFNISKSLSKLEAPPVDESFLYEDGETLNPSDANFSKFLEMEMQGETFALPLGDHSTFGKTVGEALKNLQEKYHISDDNTVIDNRNDSV